MKTQNPTYKFNRKSNNCYCWLIETVKHVESSRLDAVLLEQIVKKGEIN